MKIASPSSTLDEKESWGGDPCGVELDVCWWFDGHCDRNFSGTSADALLSLYAFPKFTISLARTRVCTESENCPVLESKKLIGITSSSTDHFGDPSAAVVAATPQESFDPYPTTGDRDHNKRSR